MPPILELSRELKWDARFLRQARDWSRYSKDPSTKTGAVVVRPDLSVAALGFNGFPPGVDDCPERYADRDLKYDLILHCEINATDSVPEPLCGYTLYTWPFMSCVRCATQVIKRRFARCVAPRIPPEKEARWGTSMSRARMIFTEAGIALVEYTMEEIEAAWALDDKEYPPYG